MDLARHFDPKSSARRLLCEAMTAALGTLAPDGFPFVSLVTVATEPDGTPNMLLSALALHTRNLEADGRASLLLRPGGTAPGDPLALGRLTLVGRAERVTRADMPKGRFLARHPAAALYADFPDFAFWRLRPERGHLVAGFGRIVEIEPADLLVDLRGAEALVGAEPALVEELAREHAGRFGEGWTVIGLDPEGVDLGNGEAARRIAFPERAVTPEECRARVASLLASGLGAPPAPG